MKNKKMMITIAYLFTLTIPTITTTAMMKQTNINNKNSLLNIPINTNKNNINNIEKKDISIYDSSSTCISMTTSTQSILTNQSMKFDQNLNNQKNAGLIEIKNQKKQSNIEQNLNINNLILNNTEKKQNTNDHSNFNNLENKNSNFGESKVEIDLLVNTDEDVKINKIKTTMEKPKLKNALYNENDFNQDNLNKNQIQQKKTIILKDLTPKNKLNLKKALYYIKNKKTLNSTKNTIDSNSNSKKKIINNNTYYCNKNTEKGEHPQQRRPQHPNQQHQPNKNNNLNSNFNKENDNTINGKQIRYYNEGGFNDYYQYDVKKATIPDTKIITTVYYDAYNRIHIVENGVDSYYNNNIKHEIIDGIDYYIETNDINPFIVIQHSIDKDGIDTYTIGDTIHKKFLKTNQHYIIDLRIPSVKIKISENKYQELPEKEKEQLINTFLS